MVMRRRQWSSLVRLASAMIIVCMVCACTAFTSPGERAYAIALNGGFEQLDIPAGRLTLRAYRRITNPRAELIVYIEGDGAPWPRPHLPPADPTPHDPTALRLAVADPAQNVAWIARPCQYLTAADLSKCDPQLWSAARYGDEAIRIMTLAVDRLADDATRQGLVLAGYSGGGTIAALLAARRSDVTRLITVAAPLDVSAWVALHELTPLAQSRNPVQDLSRLSQVPQFHFAGARDKIVPPHLTDDFARKVGATARVIRVEGFDHDCCWGRDWAGLIANTR